MKKLLVGLSLALACTGILAAPTPANRQLAIAYIERFHQLAVLESLRSGIPASIKLAQGLHESGSGTSKLALKSNNHFGIKWTGQSNSAYVEEFDDEYRRGKKIKSRFIQFESPEASYTYHTDFLMQGKLYSTLFQYDRDDYQAWAYGLKSAGYATDPHYATKLIRLIESYNLDRYDIPTQLSLEDVAVERTPENGHNLLEENELFEMSDTETESFEQPKPAQQGTLRTVSSILVGQPERAAKKENSAKPRTEPQAYSTTTTRASEPTEEHILFEMVAEPSTKSTTQKQRQHRKK
jgi:hypothetical protein